MESCVPQILLTHNKCNNNVDRYYQIETNVHALPGIADCLLQKACPNGDTVPHAHHARSDREMSK